jgi:hypothetical protein
MHIVPMSRTNFVHPKNLGAFFSNPEGIPALMPKAKRLLELRMTLAELLPESIARSCSIANYRQGKVIVFAENGAVAAKLKLLRPALRVHLSNRGIEVTVMEVEVQPPGQAPEVPEKTATMSLLAAESLTRLSAQLPDSELKNSIARLARRKRR